MHFTCIAEMRLQNASTLVKSVSQMLLLYTSMWSKNKKKNRPLSSAILFWRQEGIALEKKILTDT